MISGGELPRSKRSNRVSIPIQKPPQKTIIQRMPANRRNRSRQLPNALLGHYARPHNATSTSVFLKLCVGVPTKKNRNRNGIISWPIYCMKLDHNLGFLIWRNPHTSSTMHGKKYRKWARHNSRPDTRSGQPTTQRSTSPGMWTNSDIMRRKTAIASKTKH